MNTERIFLIGYMGAGKTKVGQLLAQALRWTFVDLDDYIESLSGQSISALFENKGEKGFREIEQQCLREVAQQEQVIVSTGGGAPCYQDNMAFMNQCGNTLYIQVSSQELARRLNESSSKSKRPLIKDLHPEELEKKIDEMLFQREPYYLQSKIIVKTGNQSKEESMERILKALQTSR